MQRFRFRLQRVLQWQERVCRLAEEQLRERQSAVAETEAKQARLAAESEAIEREFASQTSLALRDLRALATYRTGSTTRRRALAQERETRLTALSEQRGILLAERRKLHVIEKLRDRALEEHTREADREIEQMSYESYLSTWVTRRRA